MLSLHGCMNRTKLQPTAEAEELNLRFMLKVGKEIGTPYPAKSTYQILRGLYRHTKSQWKECPNFVD